MSEPIDLSECPFGCLRVDHDEKGLPINCPNGACLEHHGDKCYTLEDLKEEDIFYEVVLPPKVQ